MRAVIRVCLLLVGLLPSAVIGQAALDCEGFRSSALAIPEPWFDHTRTFANGAIRVTLIDTVEPAAGAFYLLVQAPPLDELGNRACAVIGADQSGKGFASLTWTDLIADYDAETGLTVRVPVQTFAAETSSFNPAALDVTINQAEGTIKPRLRAE